MNVWIGLPLAAVAFFLDKFVNAARKAKAEFLASAAEADQIQQEVNATHDMVALFDRMKGFMIAVYPKLFAPLLLEVPMRFMMRLWVEIYPDFVKRFLHKDLDAELKAANTNLTTQVRAKFAARVGRIMRTTRRAGGFMQVVNKGITLTTIPVACAVYIWFGFPHIPQTLGGGRAMNVEILVSADALPRNELFRDWLPAADQKPAETSATQEKKESIAVAVTLYLRTDHELLVRHGDGPIVALSDHAVEGIVYRGK